MEEQFVQDAISKPARLQRVLHQLGYTDWRFEQIDVLNQEFNFSATDPSGTRLGGRMDVVATFNGQKSFVIVEAKVLATADDLKQLSWYLEHCAAIGREPGSGLSTIDFNQTVGILLASEFVPGRYDVGDRKIHCVQFRFDASKFPFQPVKPPPPDPTATAAPAVYKHSWLVTIDYHRSRLRVELQPAFDELRRLCLPPGDPRLEWIIENPKGGHVAIHYKGHYVLYFFVQKNSFDVGYAAPGESAVPVRVGTGWRDALSVLAEARTQLPDILTKIDAMGEIPPGFTWGSFDGEQ